MKYWKIPVNINERLRLAYEKRLEQMGLTK